MEKEILNAELTPEEARSIISRLMGKMIEEPHYSNAVKKLVNCAIQQGAYLKKN